MYLQTGYRMGMVDIWIQVLSWDPGKEIYSAKNPLCGIYVQVEQLDRCFMNNIIDSKMITSSGLLTVLSYVQMLKSLWNN